MNRWRFNAVDRTTGRSHVLTAEGTTEEAAAALVRLGFAPGPAVSAAWRLRPGMDARWTPRLTWEPSEFSARGGEWVPASDGAFVGDLGVTNLDDRLHPGTRHFLLQSLAEHLGSGRDAADSKAKLAESVCWQWMIEAGDLLAAVSLLQDGGAGLVWRAPRVAVPKRLCILLERFGNRNRIVDVADHALRLRLAESDRADLEKRAEKQRDKAVPA